MNEILFLALFFLGTFLLGLLLERIRIPWIFAALLLGLGLAIHNPFPDLTSNPAIDLLSGLGMYFLLFIIGFELDVRKLLKSSAFIFRATSIIILFETLLGALFIHFFLHVDFAISFLLALSFATVGEAVLLPILEEFKILKTKMGQTMLSIGVLDDIVEVAAVAIVVVFIGRQAGHSHFNIWVNMAVLLSLFLLAFAIVKLRKQLTSFKYKDVPAFFLFVMFFIFLFVGIGLYVESSALAALLAGIALRNMIPKNILALIESEIKVLAYGLFAPIYFMSVGLSVDIGYLVSNPFMILLLMIVITSAAILGALVASKHELNIKQSVLLGLGASVKLSTSIVIFKLLLDRGLLASGVYSVLIGTTILFLLAVPLGMSWLIPRWKRYISSHV
ncbi:cation:proton antiporter [Candidatus Woesearchaeota archaeon]|nr:cation:proton antiporter [Candidatus Woesearchaeota archaeon]